MTAFGGGEGKPTVIGVCPGCGSSMEETAGVAVYCDEKGHPVHFLQVCLKCAHLFERGSSKVRMALFDRIGESEAAFLICPAVGQEIAVH